MVDEEEDRARSASRHRLPTLMRRNASLAEVEEQARYYSYYSYYIYHSYYSYYTYYTYHSYYSYYHLLLTTLTTRWVAKFRICLAASIGWVVV